MNGAKLCRLNSPGRWLSTSSIFAPGSSRASSRTIGQRRRYTQAALKTRPEGGQRTARDDFVNSTPPSNSARKQSYAPRAIPSYSEQQSSERLSESELGLRQREGVSNQTFSDHLEGLFPGLKFPPQLASRILTHASHPAAVYGHNGRLGFIGRRVMETYLLLLVSSSPNLQPSHDMEDIINRTLSTYVIGQHVGSSWGLGRVTRWTPAVDPETLKRAVDVDDSSAVRKLGLYKVQGEAVAAIIGGVYQNFGASTAHRLFHTRLLPSLIVGQGEVAIPAAFHGDVRAACNRLGGLQAPLLTGSGQGNAQENNSTHIF